MSNQFWREPTEEREQFLQLVVQWTELETWICRQFPSFFQDPDKETVFQILVVYPGAAIWSKARLSFWTRVLDQHQYVYSRPMMQEWFSSRLLTRLQDAKHLQATIEMTWEPAMRFRKSVSPQLLSGNSNPFRRLLESGKMKKEESETL